MSNLNIKNFYCGRCGKEITVEKKYLTQLCQTKMKNKDVYLVNVSYACPCCAQVTHLELIYSKSIRPEMDEINLYTDTGTVIKV